MPKAAELPLVEGAEFRVIKPYEFAKDGYRFLHGVALAWHNGTLYASLGHNKGGENTDTEEARFCSSRDGGKTWSRVATIDSGDEPGIGVSHGVFLSHKGRLWAIHGAYTGTMQKVHTRAYLLDETTGKWERKGTVVEGGFWALGEPQRMNDGNWIMAGFRAGGGNPAAVAISHGNDLTKWDLVVIPLAQDLGEVRAGFCRGVLVQGPGCLSVLQWPPNGADSCASRRPRHSPGARAAVGDLRAEAIALLPR